MPKRKANLESTIYQTKDGRWHGRVTMGVKPDGREDRRHREAATENAVKAKVKELEKQRDAGRVVKAGRVPTIEQWMTTYLTVVAPQKVKPRTLDDYWSKARNDIIPGIGKHRIDRLLPEHLEALYLDLAKQGHAPSHVLKVHRIISRALKIAHRRELVGRNVATLLDAPSVTEIEITPLSDVEARAILRAAQSRRNALRWGIGMSLGLRQGEALGLRRAYLDLDTGSIKVWWQLQRLSWSHGCDDPHACGKHLHKNAPCRPNCAKHAAYKRGCPKPCPPGCVAHASACPKRTGGGLVFTEPKAKSKRIVPIPPPLIPLLREHLKWLDEVREKAGTLWEEHDLLFSQPNGRPIDPRADWEEFKSLLAEAGIRDTRVHDGRHTAATLLMEQGADIRTVMEILGHSQMSVTKRYLHVSTPMAQEAMRRVGNVLWEPGKQAWKAEIGAEPASTRIARRKRRRRVV